MRREIEQSKSLPNYGLKDIPHQIHLGQQIIVKQWVFRNGSHKCIQLTLNIVYTLIHKLALAEKEKTWKLPK